MTENRQVMADNILRYMEINNVKATDICKALGFKQNTFSDWIHAKTYPRIDAIEKLANYFRISKADLVELPSYVYEAHHTKELETQLSVYDTYGYSAFHLLEAYINLPTKGKEDLMEYLEFLIIRNNINETLLSEDQATKWYESSYLN